MNIIPIFLKELENEAVTTRKMLALIPEDKYDWKPHAKSMTLRELGGHLAELPGWAGMGVTTDELDFAANPYTLPPFENNKELLTFFESQLAKSLEAVRNTNEDVLQEQWTLRNGTHILMVQQKHEVIRVALNQTTHHRAQLGVYLRLLNIAIPGSYGPSADELGK